MPIWKLDGIIFVKVGLQKERLILMQPKTILEYICVTIICDKTNKMACAPSEDWDQPGHWPSLIRFFAVRLKIIIKMSLLNDDRIFSLQETNLTYGPKINSVQTEQK